MSFLENTTDSNKTPDSDIQDILADAKAGDRSAQLLLARAYGCGTGVKKDLELAAYWCEKAAEQGDPEARLIMGEIYHLGLGVKKDKEKSIYWLEHAKSSGNREAEGELIYVKDKKSRPFQETFFTIFFIITGVVTTVAILVLILDKFLSFLIYGAHTF